MDPHLLFLFEAANLLAPVNAKTLANVPIVKHNIVIPATVKVR
jgi:hypothetical protein